MIYCWCMCTTQQTSKHIFAFGATNHSLVPSFWCNYIKWQVIWAGTNWSSLSNRQHSCALTDCVSLFCSPNRFLSQQYWGQAGKICPILCLRVNVNITSAVQCRSVCVYFNAYTWHYNLPPADHVPQWGEQDVCSAEGWVPGVGVWNGHQESLHHHCLWLSEQLHHENWPLPTG